MIIILKRYAFGRSIYTLGNSVYSQKEQLSYLYGKMDVLMKMLDTVDPEAAGVEDIDRIIEMLDEIETKCRTFRSELID